MIFFTGLLLWFVVGTLLYAAHRLDKYNKKG